MNAADKWRVIGGCLWALAVLLSYSIPGHAPGHVVASMVFSIFLAVVGGAACWLVAILKEDNK